MKRFLCVIMCFAVVLMLCSCASSRSVLSKDEDLLAGYEKSDSITELDFTSGEDIIPEGYDNYKEAVTDFALELFSQNLSEESNLVMSPVSVSTAMSLVANGAGGDTLSQLKGVIGNNADLTVMNECNRYLNSRLTAFNTKEGAYTVSNSLWLNDDFDVKAQFLQSVVNYYDAGVIRTPMSAESAVDKVNGWISENTDGRITDAVDSVDMNTVAMIINTALFDDGWTTPYTENQLSEGTFHGASGDTDVTYMTGEEFYISSSQGEGFVKSFKNVPLKFAAILPAEGTTLEEFAGNLTCNRLNELLNSQKPLEFCTAKMPQFSIDNKLDLDESLKALGIEDAFDEINADFSGLTITGDVHLSKVSQDAFIEVGPLGAKAGAATVATLSDASSSSQEEAKEVVLDRPFIFVIFDNESNIPVFIGAVNNI